MLEKIKGLKNSLTSKKVFRTVFLLASIISVLVGYAVADGSSVVYRDTIHVNIANDQIAEAVDSANEEEPNEADEDLITFAEIGYLTYTLSPVDMTTEVETEIETIKFSYKTVKSDTLYKGETKVTEGQFGEKKVTYTTVYINGIEISREATGEEIIKEAVPQIETVGTLRRPGDPIQTSEDVDAISTLKPDEPIALDKDGKPVNYKKIITGKSTAYCGHCDSNSTAYFGPNTARPGYVAVDPKVIPYGTKLYIVTPDGKRTYGYAIAADTGGFVKKKTGTVVDLRMEFSGSKCKCGSFWGTRNVEIYILE